MIPTVIGVLVAFALVLAAPVGVRSRFADVSRSAHRRVREPAVPTRRRSVAGGPVAAEIPAALDVLAACLAAGAAPTQAMAAVGSCFEGEVAAVFSTVASLSVLGALPEVAWSTAIEASARPRWAPVARSIIRAHYSGAALADVLVHLADDRRRSLRSDARAAAERAGVTAVLPLGLCFLPAFVLVGVVPVVAGFARTLWH